MIRRYIRGIHPKPVVKTAKTDDKHHVDVNIDANVIKSTIMEEMTRILAERYQVDDHTLRALFTNVGYESEIPSEPVVVNRSPLTDRVIQQLANRIVGRSGVVRNYSASFARGGSVTGRIGSGTSGGGAGGAGGFIGDIGGVVSDNTGGDAGNSADQSRPVIRGDHVDFYWPGRNDITFDR